MASEVREAGARRHGEDSARIFPVAGGRYSFQHVQPSSNGIGTLSANDVAVCEEAARQTHYLGQPSTVAARLGLAEDD